MPLYEYRCRNCEHQFEIQQAFSDDALTQCPECAGDLRKVFNPVGIAFKGSGFYKNDSRSSSSGSSGSSAQSKSDSSSGSDNSAGSDSKTADNSSTTKETASSSASASTSSSAGD